MTIQKIRWACTAALGACAALAVFAAWPFGVYRQPLAAGVFVALALVLPSYWSVSLTLARSDKVFYAAFAAGSLARLAGMAAAAFATHRIAPRFLTAVLLSMVGGFVFFSVVEMIFIHKQSRMAP